MLSEKFFMRLDSFGYSNYWFYRYAFAYGPIFGIGSFCCTLGIVISVLVQKRVFTSNVKISKLGIRLLIESLLVCIPYQHCF
ncbi:hypothetical protein L596_029323 [Steinernema carpocapsae]|uniref:Uncharacterized protein n=1 Tax=Steinernema carpocapsae TaxID=34508 RepID=A0A4V5ZXG2_STECR|nr:hypothetical protein L596_029323 [Steinernema carpocapsae]